MTMNPNQYKEIESFIKATLSQVSSLLDAETIDSVNHYLDNAEIEMAFEGLYIEIMTQPSTSSLIDFNKSKNAALLLGLDKETVFEPNFWAMFEKFLHS
jgi:hypothetical protein